MRYPGRVRQLALAIVLGACGRLNFDPFETTGDGAADSPVLPDGPRIWLRMETDPNGSILDSGGGHTVTCANSGCPSLTAGARGQGYQFVPDQELQITFAPDLDASAGFTSALWVEISVKPTAQSCIFDQPSPAGDTFVLCIDPDGSTLFDNEDPSGTANVLGGAPLSLGVWHHLAFTWDGTTKTVYQDGAFVDSSVTGIDISTMGMSVGSINGGIDEVTFYDRALTAAEVALLAMP